MRMTRKRRRAMERKNKLAQSSKTMLRTATRITAALTFWMGTLTTVTSAMPQSGQVVAGQASITQQQNAMQINQVSDKTSINWRSFGIGSDEKVVFMQPSSQSVALNRVIGNDPSNIFGQLTANGQVFLVNPNGVLFAKGSNVDVGGLVASTLNISDKDLWNGNYSFRNQVGGSVINYGTLTAAPGGFIVLAGSQVSNVGNIFAPQGTVALAAAGQVVLNIPGDGRISLLADSPINNAKVDNSGKIVTEGGQAILTGRAANTMLSSVVNHSGIIEAKTIDTLGGVIRLDGGSSGSVTISGALDATGKNAGESGGKVDIRGDEIKLASSAKFEVSGSSGGGRATVGGNYQGQGTDTKATLVEVEKGASIKADAITRGDGGQVVFWSDGVMKFRGDISAKGGQEAGNGGMVETSGKEELDVRGTVNASAAQGQAGTWLMDPRNVTIQSGVAFGTAGEPDFTAVSDSAIVTTQSIATALNGGTNVSVNTGTSGLQSGNITIKDNIAKTSGGDATLSLNAANNIVLESNKAITSTNGKLNVSFNADSDGQYGGYIQLQAGSSIVTNGGAVDLYGGNSGPNAGYAGSVIADTPGIALQGSVTLDTTVSDGIGGKINLRGSNSGNSINDSTSGNYLGISLAGSGNVIKSGGGDILLTALGHGYYAGQEALSITDASAQISAGSGATIITADSMKFSGQIGGAEGDSGTLTLKPLNQTTNIAIGDGAVTAAQTAETAAAAAAITNNASGIITALKLSSAVFSNVIGSGISSVTVGADNTSNYNGSAGTINVNNVTFANRIILNAPGLSESPAQSGNITITGTMNAAGQDLTLNSYQGVSSASNGVITVGGLELIDPRQTAVYNLSSATHQVDTIAANTGRLIYTGSGATTIGAVGATEGITVRSASGSVVSLTGSGSDLTINKAVSSLTAGASLDLTTAGNIAVTDTAISTNNGSLSLTAEGFVTNGVSSLTAGTSVLTLTADTMTFSDTTSVTGSGALKLQPNSLTQTVNIGGGTGDGLNLGGALFHLESGTPVFHDGFSAITIGQNAGTGTVTVDGEVTFHDEVVIQSPSGGTVLLAATGNLDNLATNEDITIKAGTFQTVDGGSLKAGDGTLIIEAGALALPAGSVSGSGILEIHPQSAGDDINLGSGASGLILPTAAFNGDSRVFQDGFSQINIGRSDGTGAVTVSADGITFTDKTLIQSPLIGGTLTVNGPLDTGSNNLTLNIGNSASQDAIGVITTAGLELLGRVTIANPDGSGTRGPKTVYNFVAAENQIGTVAANNVNQVLINNGINLTVGTVNDTTGLQANRLYNTNNSLSSVDKVTLQVSSAGGKLTVADAPLSSTGGGDISLTADQMAFSGTASVTGSGNLLIQPITATRPIDIGSFTLDAEHLQLVSTLFDGNVIKNGFDLVTIGRDGNAGSSGKITFAGDVIFKDATTIQSPNITTPGEIYLAKTANITVADVAYSWGNSLTLDAKTISADTSDVCQQAQINATSGQGYVNLKGDTISLGSGTDAGATITGNGSRTLYLRPFATSTTVDIGTDFVTDASHLQFSNDQFNDESNKIYSGFAGYVIGGNVTSNLNVTGTAHFVGALGLEGSTITVADGGLVDPTGSVRLKADTMNFGKLAHVTGSYSLQLHPYISTTGMVVGETAGYNSAENLLIPNGYFDGNDRTADGGGTAGLDGTARVFTGDYYNTVTFGSTDSAESVTMKNAVFPSTPSVPDNISIQAISTGTVDITGTIAVNKNISVWGGTITTQPGARLESANGSIALSGNVFNLNSGERSITGTHDLYLRPYSYSGNVGLVGDGVTYDGGLTLSQNMFYVQNGLATLSSGALDNTFSKITVGYGQYGQYSDYGTGTITINDIELNNDLDLLSYRSDGSGNGNIQVQGDLTASGKTITMKASGGATQSGGVITADNLALLGGSGAYREVNYDLQGANEVNTLAANVGSVKFRNAQDLTIGTISGALGGSSNVTVNGITATYAENGAQVIKSTGGVSVSSDAGLTVEQQVKSVNGVNSIIDGVDTAINLQAGTMLTTSDASSIISVTGSTGNITLTADNMNFAADSRVSGTGELNIRPLQTSTDVGIGGGGGNTLELANTLFSGGNQVFQDGFTMLNIGHASGTGTVTVDNSVTFTDSVTIQAPNAGGKVILGSAGNIDNSATNQPITLKAETIITNDSSSMNTGSGTTTLIGSNIDFSLGGSITGTGMLAVQALDTTTRIALGTDGDGGLQINSTDFNNVVSSDFDNITVGQSAGANPIVVNDFTSPTSLILQSPSADGSVTVQGTLNMAGRDLTITADGKIDGSTGTLANVATLTATSTSDAIDFSKSTTSDGVTTFANTISNLGAISANKSISIGSNNSDSLNSNSSGLTVSGQINSTTGNVLVRTTGNLTLDTSGRVTTMPTTGGDIYLSAEGTYAHFFNNSSSGATALSPGSGLWLVYSYSPIADDTIPDATGLTHTIDVTGGLVKDYKYYGYNYNNHSPETVSAPTTNLSGKRGMLYAYAPFLTPTSATRTYGYGNQTIDYTFDGFLPGDTEINTGTEHITQTQFISTTAVEGTNAGHYTGAAGITTTHQIATEIGYIIKSDVTVPLDILKRIITVTADNQSKIYSGTAADDPNFTYAISSSGWYDDGSNTDYSNRNTIITGTLDRLSDSQNAGVYNNDIIQGSLQGNINYDINYIAGDYTIYKKPITVTNGSITADNKVYDASRNATINLSATLTGVVVSDEGNVSVNSVDAAGLFTDKNAANGKTVYVSGLSIVGTAADNYSLSNAKTYTTTADITPRPIAIVAGDASKIYGDANDTAVYTAESLFAVANDGRQVDGVTTMSMAGSETVSSVTNTFYTSAAHNTEVDEATFVGSSYKILSSTPVFGSGGSESNYDVHYVDGSLQINQRPITITAANDSKTYGDANPTVNGFTVESDGTGTSRGLAGTDSVSSVTNMLHTGGTPDDAIDVYTTIGSYKVTPSTAQFDIGNGDNYLITYADGIFTINKRILTISPNNVSKTYGSVDPELSYSLVSGTYAPGDNALAGLLTRNSGENVGSYTFTQSNLQISNSSSQDRTTNYDILYTADRGLLSINPAALTVTANAQSKTYGQTDPELTYQVTGMVTNGSLGISDTEGNVLSGGLSRAVGETVALGPYAINQGSLLSNGNYTISYTGNDLTINKADLNVAAQNVAKIYGQADPTLQYTTNVINNSVVQDTVAEVLSGSLHRAAGETVAAGPYAVDQGSLELAGASSNYNLIFNANEAKLTINPATLTVTANAKSKTYGNTDPSLTYQVTGIVNGVLGITDTQESVLSGGLSRAVGETVAAGPYVINQGSLLANNNYALSYTGANLVINARPVTVVPTITGKTYGDNDPELNYSLAGGSTLATWDSNGGTLGRAEGQNAGDYNFNTNPLTIVKTDDSSNSKANYTISISPSQFTIDKAVLAVAVDAKAKIYGDLDPGLTYQIVGYKNSETAAVLDTSPTATTTALQYSNVGGYAITAANGLDNNYSFSYTPNNLTVTARPITVTADSGQHKTYGDSDSAFSYGTSNMVNNDTLSGSLDRAAGENAGAYALGQGSLANSNYSITTFNSADYTIDKAVLAVAVDAKAKIYGDLNPGLTYQITGYKNSETSAELDTSPTATTTALQYSNVGGYAITAANGLDNNYSFSYIPNVLTVTARPITVTADSGQHKTYGDSDSAFSYGTSNMVNNDTLSGSMERVTGENAGAYALGQGSLANSNYSITTFNSADFTIDKAVLAVIADAKEKIYGDANPLLTYQITGYKNSETSAVLDTMPTASTTATQYTSVGAYEISVANGLDNNYSFSYIPNVLTVTARPITVTADSGQHKTYGDSDSAFSYGTSNMVNNDTLSGSMERVTGENAGAYALGQGSLANSNYSITTFNSADFTIDKAVLAVIADAKEKIYGDANPLLTYQITGYKNDETSAVLDTMPTASTTATQYTSVGAYEISVANGLDNNYSFSYTPNTIDITPATLTYKANPAQRYMGVANPEFTGTVEGLKNNELIENLTTGSLIFSSSADQLSIIGNYSILGSGLTVNSGNYKSYIEPDPANATALRVIGLSQAMQDVIGKTKQDVSDSPTNQVNRPVVPQVGLTVPPGSNSQPIFSILPGDGNSNTNVLAIGNSNSTLGNVTTTFGNDGGISLQFANGSNNDRENVLGDIRRNEGTAIPVFCASEEGMKPEGMFNLRYNNNQLSLIPSGQKVSAQEYPNLDSGSNTTFRMTGSSGVVGLFRLTSVNNVLVIQRIEGAGECFIKETSATARKTVAANGVLVAIRQLGVIPDQIKAIYIQKD